MINRVIATIASVRPGGEVLLHDAERPHYTELLASAGLLPVMVQGRTAVFVRVF